MHAANLIRHGVPSSYTSGIVTITFQGLLEAASNNSIWAPWMMNSTGCSLLISNRLAMTEVHAAILLNA
jgi:hypothetical protein